MDLPTTQLQQADAGEATRVLDWATQTAQRSPGGRRVMDNIRAEERIESVAWLSFEQALAAALRAGSSYVSAIVSAIQPSHLLQGTPAEHEYQPRSVSRLMKIRALRRYIRPAAALAFGAKDDALLAQILEEKHFGPRDLLADTALRGKLPILWITFTDEVENHFQGFPRDIDRLCDRLGLTDFNKDDYVVELRWSVGTADGLRIPTVLDAGTNAAFSPTPKVEGDTSGFAEDLETGDVGLPEVVHGPIPTLSITDLISRQQRLRNVSHSTKYEY